MKQNIDKISKEYMRQEPDAYGSSVPRDLDGDAGLVSGPPRTDHRRACFTLVAFVTIGLVWRRVAKQSPESLPTFFTAVSGFRMLLALAVMFVYYLVAGRDKMLPFFLVFMVFYLVSLAHHSIFFARVSNRS